MLGSMLSLNSEIRTPKYLTLLCSNMLSFEQFADYLVKSDVAIRLTSFDLQFAAMSGLLWVEMFYKLFCSLLFDPNSVQSLLSQNAFEIFLSKFCQQVRFIAPFIWFSIEKYVV